MYYIIRAEKSGVDIVRPTSTVVDRTIDLVEAEKLADKHSLDNPKFDHYVMTASYRCSCSISLLRYNL